MTGCRMACIVDWSFVSKTLLDLRPKPDDSNICKKTTDFSENPSKIKDFRKSNSGFHQKLQILIENYRFCAKIYRLRFGLI